MNLVKATTNGRGADGNDYGERGRSNWLRHFMAFNPLRFVATPTTPKSREERVAEAAYFIALKRGFLPGYEAADWAAAEKEVDEAYQSSDLFKGELAP